MEKDDDDLYVTCAVTGQRVLRCPCGPHEDCPEHFANCLAEEDER
jgi:hypothetical protein